MRSNEMKTVMKYRQSFARATRWCQLRVGILWMLLAVLTGTPLFAQSMASGGDTDGLIDLETFRQTSVYERNARALNRTVSIHMDQMTRKYALRHVAALGDFRVTYDADIPSLHEKISLDLEGLTVFEALQEVIRGSDLLLTLSYRGMLIVRQSPNVQEPERRSGLRALFSRNVATGIVTGRATDAQTGEALPGATLRIDGTSMGAAADIEGNYRITGVPEGQQTLLASYVGYEPREYQIVVPPNETITQDVELSMGVIEGEDILVTAQFEGQARAINQQVNSEQIVNVVSSDRIRELPDANAAESVGRLPGVAIQRNAGEGSKLNIRGLSPRFTNITINGQKVPATGDDRSVDLSMISQDVLEGIELYKAITPDQDADATGGSVNFVIRRAPEGFRSRIDLQGGYNSLSSSFENYKLSGSASNRFLDDRLGVLATGTVHRADRGRDQFHVDYRPEGTNEETGELILEVIQLNLFDRLETRDRYTASLALDYQIGTHSDIRTNTFFSRTNRDILARRKEYAPSFGQVQYGLNDQELDITLWNNMLSGSHLLGPVEAEWALSQSSTLDRMPFQTGLTFEENAPFDETLVTDRGPFPLPDAAKNNLAQTPLQGGGNLNTNRGVERDLGATLNLKIPFNFNSQIGGYLKFGGKHTDKMRRFQADAFVRPNSTSFLLIRDNPGEFKLYNASPTVENFMDEDFDPGDFMDGRFDFNARLRADAAREIYETYADSLAVSSRYAELNDYDANEAITAGYVMTRLNLGRRIMLLGGVRYERTENDYEARFTSNISGQFGQQGQVVDTTGGQTYGELLPMVHLRINMTDQLSLRLATTRTLARPLYRNLSPGGRINFGGFRASITRGNPDLKHTTAWNYDASLAFYSGRLGLISVSGFYKSLQNIDYRANLVITDPESRYVGFDLNAPRNAEGTTSAYGFESEIQTNLRFLPSPLDGIIINANYTRTFGETVFPFLDVVTGPPPLYQQEFIAGEREGPLPGQSDHIANISLGYEKGGFSGRISMVYQSEFLNSVGQTPEGDSYFDDFRRFDVTLTQRVFRNASVYLHGSNITGLTERSLQGDRSIYIENEEDYGSTYSLGFRYLFE